MCTTTIDADCILVILLQTKKQVTVRQLKEVRMTIERQFSSVYVDLTKNCLIGVVNRWPEVLLWEDDVIRRLAEWPRGYLEEISNAQIPDDIRLGVLKTLHASGEAQLGY